MPLWLQYLLIALAVLASAFVVLKKYLPGPLRKARIAVAIPLLREGRPAWQQALGRRIAPEARAVGKGSCGGCDGCD